MFRRTHRNIAANAPLIPLRILLPAVCLCLAALLGGCAGQEPDDAVPAQAAAPVFTEPPSLTIADQSGHLPLMGLAGGLFCPELPVTRSAVCTLLYPLLRGFDSEILADGADVLAAAGLLPWTTEDAAVTDDDAANYNAADDSSADDDGDAEVTRGELTQLLQNIAGCLSGGEAERALAAAADVSTAGDGDDAITRAELAVALERLAGREPDEAGLIIAECLPDDVKPFDYAWAYIADAVTGGPVEPASPGVHRAYDWLYAVWDDGTLVVDMDYGVWTFGLDGRYTTGSAELDSYIADALEVSGANGLTGDDALAAAYLYIKYNFEYIVQPEDMDVLDPGVVGWEYERALRFFRNGGGTCYGYAAAFGLMARALGETAYIISAEVNQYYGAHSVVILHKDGRDLIYDVELEATRQERHADLELFGIENHAIYHYWYEPDWDMA